MLEIFLVVRELYVQFKMENQTVHVLLERQEILRKDAAVISMFDYSAQIFDDDKK